MAIAESGSLLNLKRAFSISPTESIELLDVKGRWDKVRHCVHEIFGGIDRKRGIIPMSSSYYPEWAVSVHIEGIEYHISPFAAVRVSWENSQVDLSLMEFIPTFLEGSKRIEEDLGLVPYFSEEVVSKAEVEVREGLFYQLGDLLPTDTYLYVLTRAKRLLLSPLIVFDAGAVLCHSSLSRGRPVRAVGEMELREGRLVRITNDSRCYFPGRRSMINSVKWLEKQGISADTFDLSFKTADGAALCSSAYFPATRFLEREGRA